MPIGVLSSYLQKINRKNLIKPLWFRVIVVFL